MSLQLYKRHHPSDRSSSQLACLGSSLKVLVTITVGLVGLRLDAALQTWQGPWSWGLSTVRGGHHLKP